jgi:hypothetical protein
MEFVTPLLDIRNVSLPDIPIPRALATHYLFSLIV